MREVGENKIGSDKLPLVECIAVKCIYDGPSTQATDPLPPSTSPKLQVYPPAPTDTCWYTAATDNDSKGYFIYIQNVFAG